MTRKILAGLISFTALFSFVGSATAAVDGASFSLKISRTGTAVLKIATSKGSLNFLSVRSSKFTIRQSTVTADLTRKVGSISFNGLQSERDVVLPSMISGHPEVPTDKSKYVGITSGSPADGTWFAMLARFGSGITAPLAFNFSKGMTSASLTLTTPLLSGSNSCKSVYSGSAYLTRFGAKPVTIPFSGRCT